MPEIDELFYKCTECGEWQGFMGRDVVCDFCGHLNDFTDEEVQQLEEAAEREL